MKDMIAKEIEDHHAQLMHKLHEIVATNPTAFDDAVVTNVDYCGVIITLGELRATLTPKAKEPEVRYGGHYWCETCGAYHINGTVCEKAAKPATCLDCGNVHENSCVNTNEAKETCETCGCSRPPAITPSNNRHCDFHGMVVIKTGTCASWKAKVAKPLTLADVPWIFVPYYPGSTNKIQMAIEQLQKAVDELRKQ